MNVIAVDNRAAAGKPYNTDAVSGITQDFIIRPHHSLAVGDIDTVACVGVNGVIPQ